MDVRSSDALTRYLTTIRVICPHCSKSVTVKKNGNGSITSSCHECDEKQSWNSIVDFAHVLNTDGNVAQCIKCSNFLASSVQETDMFRRIGTFITCMCDQHCVYSVPVNRNGLRQE